MMVFYRFLLVLLSFDVVICGVLIGRQLWRNDAVLPQVQYDDPLLESQLKVLADLAEQGDTRDWSLLGAALLGQGFYGEAEHSFREALDQEPANQPAQFALAFCLERTGRIAEGIEAYRLAAEMPESSQSSLTTHNHCRYAIAKNLLRLEKAEEAEAEFQTIRGFAPADYQLAKLLIHEGRAKEALPIIEANLQRTPISLGFQFLRYRAMTQLNRPEEAFAAARDLERSQYVIPTSFNTNYVEPMNPLVGLPNAFERYNQAVREQKPPGEMLEILKSLLVPIEGRRLPFVRMIWMSLAEVAFQQQDPQLMLDALKQLRMFGEMNADILQLEGAALMLQEQWQEAARLWERAVEMSPNVPLLQMLATAAEKRGDAAARDRALGQRALLAAKIAYWSNQLPEAVSNLAEAKRLIPDEPQVWFYSAEIERSSGDNAKAKSDLERCLELNPNHGRAIRMLEWLNAQGD